ncbi:ABC transporter permease [Streptomyces caelestis]|uniref:ABC transporter permease n=1 Tax=Streptomyces caelestis TaxID=36816 RepID=UPI0037F75AC9
MTAISSAMAFEWTKIRTVRATTWSLALYFLATLAVALLTGYYLRSSYDSRDSEALSTFDPVAAGFSGLRLGLIALVVFGVLIVTSEYSTGTVRTSLAAVPRRGVFYGAKLLTGTVTALVVSTVVVTVGFFATQLAMGDPQSVSLLDDGVLRSLVGAVLYTTLLCVFAMGLASVLRSSALTMGILVPLFFMISTILTNLPGVRDVAQFLPDVAGGLILYRDQPDDTVLNAWTGMAVLGAWAAAAVTAGYAVSRRRDA